VDWNNSGKFDLIAGDTTGEVWYYKNIGTKTAPELAKGVLVEAGGKPIKATQNTYKQVNGQTQIDKTIPGSSPLAETYSKLHVADWDGDGLKDLLIGHNSNIIFYKNIGTKDEPKFADPVLLAPGAFIGGKPAAAWRGGPQMGEGVTQFPFRPSPYVVDMVGDGKPGLMVGSDDGKVFFYRNVGTKEKPVLDMGKEVKLDFPAGANKGYRFRFDVVDWNNRGKKDLLIGNFYSGSGTGTERQSGGNLWLFLAK
jgi:hypothetical protein